MITLDEMILFHHSMLLLIFRMLKDNPVRQPKQQQINEMFNLTK